MIVGELSVDQLSWSIRLGSSKRGDDQGSRIFEELVELLPELLTQCFPASCGYEAHGVRLDGPLDGVCWTVVRGPFRAELGLQRYGRRASGSAVTLRLVATAGPCEADSTDAETLERRVMGRALAGWGLGGVALGVLLLSLHGLGSLSWAELLLLVPAVAVWRASAALVRRALPPAPERLALVAAQAPVVDGLRRWRALLPALRAQHDLLQATMESAPFRSPGHLGITHDPRARVRQALAAASPVAWPRPPLVAIERRQRSCSASTGKNDT
jgi:hypothetical protein